MIAKINFFCIFQAYRPLINMEDDAVEKIIAVAFHHSKTKVTIVRQNFTSHTSVEDGAAMHGVHVFEQPWEKGFLTSNGRFVDRTEGMEIARKADQLKPGVDENAPYLTSEDVKWVIIE